MTTPAPSSPLRRTKIVATLGPASDRPGVLEAMLKAGVDVVRLNFSHGSADDHRRRLNDVREIAQRLGRSVAALGDLQGPKIRISRFAEGSVQLEVGQPFVLDMALDAQQGTAERVGCDYKALIEDVRPGDRLLLDDGRVVLDVTSISGQEVHTRVHVGGKLSNNKGINLPGVAVSVPALSDKDADGILATPVTTVARDVAAEQAAGGDPVKLLGAVGRERLAELADVVETLHRRAPGRAVADLSIARGLDYYTGTVYETVLVGHEQLGSICSGGRYDALASKGNRVFPGVGLSIGVTRLVMRMLSQQMAVASRSVPTAVYVALTADEDWSEAQDVAALLRERGIPAEVAVSAEKFGKQIKYADRRGIPFVWFMGRDDAGARVHEVKDIRSGEQHAADPADWTPPAEDLLPQVARAQD